jgi:hypothetical protein
MTCRPIVFKLYKEYLNLAAVERLKTSKYQEKNFKLKYADYFVLLVREESVLQGIVNTITGIVRCYGIEVNME